jgi:hypothetical protein
VEQSHQGRGSRYDRHSVKPPASTSSCLARFFIGAVILIGAGVPPVTAQSFTRRDPISLGVGAESGVQSFVLADVNEDGRADIVAVEQDADPPGIAVLLNDGSANFGTPQRFANEDFIDLPVAVAVADVGSRFSSESRGAPDGNVDIIVGDDSGLIIFLYGTGTGDFQFPDDAEEAIDVSADIVAIAVGNFDGQGMEDDIACVDSGGEVFFLCAVGDGVFGPCTTESLDVLDVDEDAGDPVDIVTGDFNGNGTTDVAALFSATGAVGNTVFLALGNGAGVFEAGRTAAADDDARALARGRLDDDLIDDLVVVEAQGDANGDNVTILRGSSNGTFRRSKAFLEVFSTDVALADFDNDPNGCLDMVGTSSESGTATLAIGNCDGTFSAQLVTGPAVGTALAVAAADLTGDSRPDFAVVIETGDAMRVAVNTGAAPTDTPGTPGTPGGGTVTPTPTPTRIVTPSLEGCEVALQSAADRVEPVAMAQGDFDRDGNPDMAVVDRVGSQVLVMLTDINDLRGPEAACAIPRTMSIGVGASPTSVAAADLNRDSRLDLVVTTGAGVTILLATGLEGNFAVLRTIPTGSTSGSVGDDPRSVAVDDFDRDGVADLAVASHSGNRNVVILFGNGDAEVTFTERTTRAPFNIPGALIVVSADVNGDGWPDLGVASDSANTVNVLLQNPASPGLFPGTQPAAITLAGGTPTAMVAAQVTSAPSAQLLVATRAANGNGSFVVIRRTNNAFTQGTAVVTGARPTAIGTGEFVGGTGRTDVLVASSVQDAISFFPGNSDGTFGGSVSMSTVGRAPSALVTGDFDADGVADVAVANMGEGTLTLLLSSRVPPTPSPTITLTPGPSGTPTITNTPGPSRTGTPAPTATFKEGTFELSSCSVVPAHGDRSNEASLLLLVGASVLWLGRRRAKGK